jgi:hypothetical protein
MFGLLCLPNFAKSLIIDLALANLAHLRVKILERLWNWNPRLALSADRLEQGRPP